MFGALNNTQKGILTAFAGFTGFAVADACAKWLGAHYALLPILFWTYLVSFILGLCFSPFLGGIKQTLRTKKLRIHIARTTSIMTANLFIVSALKGENSLPLSTFYTIVFLAPFCITIAACFFYKEKVFLKNWLVIALGFSGILVAFRFGLTDFSINVFYAFCALVFLVPLSLLARLLTHDETLLSLSFYPALVTIIILGPLLLQHPVFPDLNHLPVFLLNGICVTIGLSGIAYGYRIARFAVIAPIHYSQMVVALILGYLIFGDVPDLWMMAGATIIIVSGLLLIVQKEHKSRNMSDGPT